MKELLAVDKIECVNFFYRGLEEVGQPGADRRERIYVASMLAHFALTSRASGDPMFVLGDLSEVFDTFVVEHFSNPYVSASILENAGANTLLLNGFFRRPEGKRSVHWYDELGAGFYEGASIASLRGKHMQSFYAGMAEHFSLWSHDCYELAKQLRDDETSTREMIIKIQEPRP